MQNLHYNWTLKDAIFTKDRSKVFSCFACGGGSTMGYKLAGFDVIGFNEIDPRMAECYIENHKPKYAFVEPIQEFKNRADLPDELFNLDILDGSPPCSSFSMAGSREEAWGKKKKFSEGQAEQVLDTLFFDFIDLAKRLQPKVVIAENVKGLLMGEALHYVRRIKEEFEEAGYYIQWRLLDASKMGVPQRRERVFFVGLRKDLASPFLEQVDFFDCLPKLELEFNEREIVFGEISDNFDFKKNIGEITHKYWSLMGNNGGALSNVHPKKSFFNEIKCCNKLVCQTITAQGKVYHSTIPRRLNKKEFCSIGSYPQDYNFKTTRHEYLIGMSVPPLMTARIAHEIDKQWLSKIKGKE